MDTHETDLKTFDFKLVELYEHINEYSVKAHTLEEAIKKAMGGEEEVQNGEWHNGFIRTIAVMDENDNAIDILVGKSLAPDTKP